MNKVYALYDFTAELDLELSIDAGEELELVDAKDSWDDDGWSEVRNACGVIGIVPSTYITQVVSKTVQSGPVNTSESTNDKSDSKPVLQRDRSYSVSVNNVPEPKLSTKHILRNNEKRNIEKFFMDESYYQDISECQIIHDPNGKSIYKPRSEPYKVQIIGYQNTSKYIGLKSFVTYEIQTDTLTLNKTVKRRYNHFVWLYEVLEERYPNIILPTLPEKVVTGNFSKDLLESRKTQLELWLNYLSAHPVIGECETFIHFLQSDESKWKDGKRKAESDELKGGYWMNKVSAPNKDLGDKKESIEKFAKSIGNLGGRLKESIGGLEKLSRYHANSCQRDLFNLGKSFEKCGHALNEEALEAENNSKLANVFLTTGDSFIKVGNMYGEQQKDLVLYGLGLYHRILQQVPGLVQFEKNSTQVFADLAKQPECNLDQIKPKRDLVTHVTLAEMSFLNEQKVADMNMYMRDFLANKIRFYLEIVECLKRARDVFEDIPLKKS